MSSLLLRVHALVYRSIDVRVTVAIVEYFDHLLRALQDIRIVKSTMQVQQYRS